MCRSSLSHTSTSYLPCIAIERIKRGFDCGSRFLVWRQYLPIRYGHQSVSRKHGRPGLAVIGRSHSSLLQDRPVRRRSTVSKRTTFTKSGRPHVYAPIQMHDVITSAKSKTKNYQITRRQYVCRRSVQLDCLLSDYSFTVQLLATSLKKAVSHLVESLSTLTPYQSPRRHDHKYIPHFISQLSTRLLTAFFRDVANSFTIN